MTKVDSTQEKVQQALDVPPIQPKQSFLDKATKAIAWFIGSWWGVFAHTAWFAVWLILDFNIERLTLIVSLEAIFIGIFLLMYSNKAEMKRDLVQAQKQAKTLSETIADVSLDRKQLVTLEEINKKLDTLQQDVNNLKST